MRLFTLAAALLAAVVGASNVVDLDPKSFDELIGKDKPALVEFFAPWCGHCKSLAPVYEQLADAFPTDKVIIAKTDADGVGRPLGSRFDVKGYPTLKWFPAGSIKPVDYSSGRDLDSLVAFVTKESGIKSRIKPPPPPAAVQLDAANFDEIALNEDKNVLVAFTAPWCGHCKSLKPTYEKIARAYAGESDCIVAQMDADDADNKPVAARYGVKSFPTIKFFPKGSSEPIVYNTGRSEEQFATFLNEHCGTQRTATGLLTEAAGRVLPLDALAAEFASLTSDKTSILSQAREVLTTLTNSTGADYYVRAMERIAEKGEGWLAKEQARIAGLLASSNLAPKKLDELKVKSNILASFVEKVEEIVEEAKEGAEGAVEGVKGKAEQVVERIKEEL
ncbi:hypothetical protein Q5752_003303 [Cryptotrichosporon argae]